MRAERVFLGSDLAGLGLVLHVEFLLHAFGVAHPQVGRDPARADHIDQSLSLPNSVIATWSG